MIRSILKNLAKKKGVHYLLARYGSYRIKQICFNEKFLNGTWHYQAEPGDELATIVANKANKGKILILGCGTATICQVLPEDCYESILGIDLSTVAIEESMKHAKPGMKFVASDIVNYKYVETYNVILFSESIYYLTKKNRTSLLRTCQDHLSQDGVIIVTIADSKRYENILYEIRDHHSVLEDRKFENSNRHLIIFR